MEGCELAFELAKCFYDYNPTVILMICNNNNNNIINPFLENENITILENKNIIEQILTNIIFFLQFLFYP